MEIYIPAVAMVLSLSLFRVACFLDVRHGTSRPFPTVRPAYRADRTRHNHDR